MGFIEIDHAVGGVVLGTMLIARVVRAVNGAKLDSLLQFTRSEWIVLCSLCLLQAIYFAFQSIALAILMGALVAIAAVGILGGYYHQRKSVRPPAPPPGSTPESN
jgi:hypothetical protein